VAVKKNKPTPLPPDPLRDALAEPGSRFRLHQFRIAIFEKCKVLTLNARLEKIESL
jgi:hypothetical protein